MEFKLYTVASGGAAIWTETRSGANEVQVTDGLFSVMLGSVTALTGVDFDQTLYLGVNIEGDGEMSPRKILGAVPAAFEAGQLDGLDSTWFIANSFSTTSAAYWDSTVARWATTSSDYWIGTKSVSDLLDVDTRQHRRSPLTPTISSKVRRTSSGRTTDSTHVFPQRRRCRT
jgi:hypothetical protein